MRALITGATGFLGSYLTEKLQGEEVAILCRPDSNPWRIEHLLSKVERIEGSLADLPKEAISRFAPEVIFHLAWEGVSNRCRNDQIQYRNLRYTLDLLELGIEIGCRTWIGVGSQAEYGPQNTVLNEEAPLNPTTMYGAAKASSYLLGRQIAAESGIRFAWVRLFSSYGPKDGQDWLIPSLIRTLRNGQRPALTKGEQLWDYLYVEDAAEALYRIALSPEARGPFNLGSGEAYPIRTIAECIRDRIDPSLPLGLGEVPYRPDQVMHLEADIGRLRALTGWNPLIGLGAGLDRTVAYFLEGK